MDNDNMLIICRSCGRKVLMHNMRPADDGEHMICLDCYNKGASMSTETTIQKKAIENQPFSGPRKKTEKTKSEKMFKYICTNCKYKFSRKESQPVEKCPYCGKQTIVHDDQLGAENLLNDSLSKKFDW
jgi:DNA-directed RNA polymerase subunit RPC12/RpoP